MPVAVAALLLGEAGAVVATRELVGETVALDLQWVSIALATGLKPRRQTGTPKL